MKLSSGWAKNVALALVVVGAPVLALSPGADAATASKATKLETTFSSNVVDALDCSTAAFPSLEFGLTGTGPAFSRASYFDEEYDQIGSTTLKVRFTVGTRAPFDATIKNLSVYTGKELPIYPACSTIHKLLVQGAQDGAKIKAQVVSGTLTSKGKKSTITGTPSASGKLGKLTRLTISKVAKTGKKTAGGEPLWKVTGTTQVRVKSGSTHVWKATKGVSVTYTDNYCKADRKVTSGSGGGFSVTVHRMFTDGANDLDFVMGGTATSTYEGARYTWNRTSAGKLARDSRLYGGC